MQSKFRIVVMAASAGGIEAVKVILSGLPTHFPLPIVVVQHRGGGGGILETVVGSHSPLKVREAEDGDELTGGTVYVAPGGRHLRLDATGVLRLSDSEKVNFCRPAADPLFLSVADFYRERTIGVVLTGNGVDGSKGVEGIHAAGGYTIAQHPSTSETRGMPTAAINTGCVNSVLPLVEIAPALLALSNEMSQHLGLHPINRTLGQ